MLKAKSTGLQGCMHMSMYAWFKRSLGPIWDHLKRLYIERLMVSSCLLFFSTHGRIHMQHVIAFWSCMQCHYELRVAALGGSRFDR